MREEPVRFKSPPRLLLGVAFLFWGAMLDQPFVALIAAIVTEGRHWTSLRWEFGETGFARAWHLCVLILIIVAVFFLQGEERSPADSLYILSWLPFILMPLGLAQQYSSDRGVPLSTFSYFARRKLAADRREGRPAHLQYFHLGYPWLGIILITAGLGVTELYMYGGGVTILLAIALYDLRGSKLRPVAWLSSYLAALLMAAVMTWGAYYAYGYVISRSMRVGNEGTSARDIQTALGKVGELQMSNSIEWRYYQDEGVEPKLLRLATYNQANLDSWTARSRPRNFRETLEVDKERSVGGDILKLHNNEARDYSYRVKDLASSGFKNRARIIGMAKDATLLPVPMSVRRFENPAAEGIEANSLGTTQVSDPKHAALELSYQFDSAGLINQDDPYLMDLTLQEKELKGLTKFLTRLGVETSEWQESGKPVLEELEKMTRAEQEELITLLSGVFRGEFTYSLNLRPRQHGAHITHFLEEMKAGHCEYYATATAQLLRKAGVPTRYVVGYAVAEQGDEPSEWILRGRHAHAWCQAYLGGTWVQETIEGKEAVWRCRGGEWVDVDTTPPDWLGKGAPMNTWKQRLFDWAQLAREDIILWFSRPLVSLVTKILFIGLGVLLVGYLIYRLITTRRSETQAAAGSWEEQCVSWGVLKGFEKWLSKRVGPRPAGTPMSTWLQEHFSDQGSVLVSLYERLAFDPRTKDEEIRSSVEEEVARLKRVMSD